MLKSANADLFDDLFSSIELNQLTVTVRWLPSHLKEDPQKERPDWVEDWHIEGNRQADHFAGLAAKLHIVPPAISKEILTRLDQLKCIQLRAAAIVKLLPYRQVPKKFTMRHVFR